MWQSARLYVVKKAIFHALLKWAKNEARLTKGNYNLATKRQQQIFNLQLSELLKKQDYLRELQ